MLGGVEGLGGKSLGGGKCVTVLVLEMMELCMRRKTGSWVVFKATLPLGTDRGTERSWLGGLRNATNVETTIT